MSEAKGLAGGGSSYALHATRFFSRLRRAQNDTIWCKVLSNGSVAHLGALIGLTRIGPPTAIAAAAPYIDAIQRPSTSSATDII